MKNLLEGDTEAMDIANPPTLSEKATRPGILLGTAAYMSPEQAKAKPVDRRADIWAFGCVLYEMLTGKQAFQGESVTDTLAAVIRDEPNWSRLPAGTPLRVRVLLQRCLRKEPKQRLRDMGDARISLDEVLAGAPEDAPSLAATGQPQKGQLLRVVAGLAGAVVLTAVSGIAGWILKPERAKSVTRAVINLPPGQRLAGLDRPALAISPNGSELTYVATYQGGPQQIYLRALDNMKAEPIHGTEGATNPFFSPDGQWLGFFADGRLRKVLVRGGAPQTLVEVANPYGATWGSQGLIMFAPVASVLEQVPEGGGTWQAATRTGQREIMQGWPEFLPSGKAVLFAAAPNIADWVNASIAVQSVGTAEQHTLVQGATAPRFAPSGHLIYAQGGNLMVVPFDPKRLTIMGTAVAAVEGVLQSPVTGSAQYSFSTTGSLVYVPGSVQGEQSSLVWVNRSGTEMPLTAPARSYLNPRISPDGQRVAVCVSEQESQIWLYDVTRETLTRLTFEGTSNQYPVWTPDGKHVTFRSGKGGSFNSYIYWQMADGSGGLERLSGRIAGSPNSWSPDGRELATVMSTPTTGIHIVVLQLRSFSAVSGQAGDAQPSLPTPFTEGAPEFSPDGRWLAYVSYESGRPEIYVRAYPGPGAKWQISTDGGTEPVWNRNGRELFYRSGDRMMSVEVATQPTFILGRSRTLFEGSYEPTPLTLPNYDVSPDGQRFLMLKPAEQGPGARTQINVVLNWTEDLKRLVPTGE
jgi:Tol biopolymer transport system component